MEEIRCYNCKQIIPPNPGPVRVNCNESNCLWGLLICKHCYDTKIGDGTQHAVIAARAHAAEHIPFMLVRLNEGSDTRGQLVCHVRDEDELKIAIKCDLKAHGPADYLVHNTKSKQNIRVNVKSAPKVYDPLAGGKLVKREEYAETETESSVEATPIPGSDSPGPNGGEPPQGSTPPIH